MLAAEYVRMITDPFMASKSCAPAVRRCSLARHSPSWPAALPLVSPLLSKGAFQAVAQLELLLRPSLGSLWPTLSHTRLALLSKRPALRKSNAPHPFSGLVFSWPQTPHQAPSLPCCNTARNSLQACGCGGGLIACHPSPLSPPPLSPGQLHKREATPRLEQPGEYWLAICLTPPLCEAPECATFGSFGPVPTSARVLPAGHVRRRTPLLTAL